MRTPEGFTVEVLASCSEHDLELMVRPDTDYDSTFEAWCLAEQEMLRVNGWLFVIEEVVNDVASA
jgi:hypothetical protein